MTESLLQEVSTNTGIPVKELRPLWNEAKQEANRLSHRPGSSHWTQTSFTLFKSKAAALAASREPVEEPIVDSWTQDNSIIEDASVDDGPVLEQYSNDEPEGVESSDESLKKARKNKD